ncbi:MAG: hypothetical protein Q4A46_08080, partial [Clostridia bacterium]|nr:hypothetical protein [Clostridia bacterium]
MKTKLKQNGGFAIVGVIFLLLVLSLLGTAMFAYSVTSLRSLRFSTEGKKAEYLAKAGVEVAAYAYQTAFSDMNKTGIDPSYGKFISDINGLDGEAESEPVYLIWNGDTAKYEFLSTDPNSSGLENFVYIGYFTVKIETEELEFINTYKPEETIVGQAKQFVATGHSGKNGTTYVSYGFFPDSTSGAGKKFYTDDGFIQFPTDSTPSNKDSYTPYASMADSPFKIEIRRFFTTKFFKWLTGQDSFNLADIYIMPFGAVSAGNFVLDKPANSDTIRFYAGQSGYSATAGNTLNYNGSKYDSSSNYCNSVVFAAGDSIFVQANLDVTPAKGGLNAISLSGQNIVVNGNIEMYVYCLPDTSNQTLIRSIVNTATKGYGLGKVILGVPVIWDADASNGPDQPKGKKVPQPAYTDSLGNGILSGASFMSAGKVYFGGNVTVT